MEESLSLFKRSTECGWRMADGGWRMVEMNVEVEAGQWLKRLEESWVWNLSLFIQ